MSVDAPSRDAELERLYRRFKGLALGVSAAMMLDGWRDELVDEADQLLSDCLRSGQESCVAAGSALAALVASAAAGEPAALELEQLRTAHTRLRREVWAVVPCEYVPCCVSGAHHEARGVK